ncbi:MAG: threonine/serine exporter family protein, partial [Agathobacter sp.]|nr:threonine/serine exporter family protein [Agathobacter sp.]
KFSRFLRNVFTSMFVSACTILVVYTGLPVLQDKIIIGAIMPLVPGITFTTSIRDFHNGDYLSGTIHLIDALLTALCVAVGIIIPMALFNSMGGGALLP